MIKLDLFLQRLHDILNMQTKLIQMFDKKSA